MISLVLPYWDRQAAANRAFDSLKAYEGLDLEVIVVDDGNPVPFAVPRTGLNVRVLRLPEKTVPKPPARAWNEGVKVAQGDIIVLSCVEVIHPAPVLAELADVVRSGGPMTYVLAAAWVPEQRRWHCHSSVRVPDCPEGVGLGFCAALRPELYWSVGGFDEAYMNGAGYEDRDFILRLLAAGARFVLRDDLIVHHTKVGASINWGAENFARNEQLFNSKWH